MNNELLATVALALVGATAFISVNLAIHYSFYRMWNGPTERKQ